MEEVKQVLALFDSKDKWNAFIELSNMRAELVNELKDRLALELRKIAEKELADTGWTFYADYNCMRIDPMEPKMLGITIEWGSWNEPWSRRCACIWVNANSIDSFKVCDKIKSYRRQLPLQYYEENVQNHRWLPFVKQIPARVFDVDNDITSVEKCLYTAKDYASQLARNLWEEVYKPFANKEIADLMRSIVKQ